MLNFITTLKRLSFDFLSKTSLFCLRFFESLIFWSFFFEVRRFLFDIFYNHSRFFHWFAIWHIYFFSVQFFSNITMQYLNQIIDLYWIRQNFDLLSFQRFQIKNQLKNCLSETMFYSVKFFVNVNYTKFDWINVFFQKSGKFHSNKRKFYDVQINSIMSSNSIEFWNLIW